MARLHRLSALAPLGLLLLTSADAPPPAPDSTAAAAPVRAPRRLTLEPALVDERNRPLASAVSPEALLRRPIMPPDALVLPTMVVRGPYVSVQVNVGPGGANISGDAANEPSIAIDPNVPARMAIGWRQFNTVASNFRQAGRAYSSDAGRTWTFPGVLTPGVFRSDPVLDSDAHNAFYYCSLQSDFSMQMFKSNDGGRSWGAPIPAFGGDKAWMVVDKNPSLPTAIYISWSSAAGCCGERVFTRSLDGGSSYDEPIAVPGDIHFGTLALGPNGELYVIGANDLADTFTIDRCSNPRSPGGVVFDLSADVEFSGSQVVGGGPNPEGLLGQVWVGVDTSNGPRRGFVYALCSVDPPGPDPLDVLFTRSEDAGATWSAPVRINDDPEGANAWQWFGALSVAPNGRLDVVWNDTRADPTVTFSELYYSHSEDGGLTWSANVPASPPFNHFLGYPQQNKIGDYCHMISDRVGATLAYAATFNAEQDVYCLRLGDYDCNRNGVGDAIDIASGASSDCNLNGIPDDCEIAAGAPDCNNNAVLDSCEITSGAAQDCNGNGVPDACEIASGSVQDCNHNNIPDSCDIASGAADINDNGVPDACERVGDLNNDSHVNATDLGILLGSWGPCPPLPTPCIADLNADHIVGSSDLAILLGGWTP